jgi:hypothetical protein
VCRTPRFSGIASQPRARARARERERLESDLSRCSFVCDCVRAVIVFKALSFEQRKKQTAEFRLREGRNHGFELPAHCGQDIVKYVDSLRDIHILYTSTSHTKTPFSFLTIGPLAVSVPLYVAKYPNIHPSQFDAHNNQAIQGKSLNKSIRYRSG